MRYSSQHTQHSRQIRSQIELRLRSQTWRRWFCALIFVVSLILSGTLASTIAQPAHAQISSVSAVLQQIPLGDLAADSGSSTSMENAAGWIMLDGECVFQVTAPQASLQRRIHQVETNLRQIRDQYVSQDSTDLNVTVESTGQQKLPSIYVNGTYLSTLNQQDAAVLGLAPWALAEELEQRLPNVLQEARQVRQQDARIQQASQAATLGIGALLLISLAGVFQKQTWLTDKIVDWFSKPSDPNDVEQEQHKNLHEIQRRLLQLLQVIILMGAVALILGIFPETKAIQGKVLSILRIPLLAIIVIVVAYVGARLSFVLINRFMLGLAIAPQHNRRTELRVSTVSSVLKNIAVFTWIVIGILVALAVAGINLAVLLASVSLLSVAISLIFQNLIRGAVNGIFIILEDQYAIGDVVVLEDNHGLSGVVEDFNLRVTKLRDTAGRLISVPTSQIGAVANLTNNWSRVDLQIPVAYHSDLEQAQTIMHQVAYNMQHEPDWQPLFLEEPNLLGVDDFGQHGVIIRLWIKTLPMRQWDVAREYRRRLKLAFDAANIEIPIPQQDLWFHGVDTLPLRVQGRRLGRANNRADSCDRTHSDDNYLPQPDTHNGNRPSRTATLSPNEQDVTNDDGDR